MQRKTSTTLGELREGDRFAFLKYVWQVMSKTGSFVNINQVSASGVVIHKFDHMKRSKLPVIFLRHTKPEPGDDCLVSDLKEGDLFVHLKDFTLFDWEVITVEYPTVKAEAKKWIEPDNQVKEFSWMDWVVFVGKKQEVPQQ